MCASLLTTSLHARLFLLRFSCAGKALAAEVLALKQIMQTVASSNPDLALQLEELSKAQQAAAAAARVDAAAQVVRTR